MRRLMSIITAVKLIGSALVVIGGAAMAYNLNARAKRALSITEGLINLIRHVKTQVSCYATPIDKILSGCERSVFEACGYAKEATPQSIGELIEGCPMLEGRALGVMNEFSRGFGKSYRADQVRLCESSIEELSALRSDISDKLPIRRKLNSTLCISSAMAIVILLA